MTAHAYLCSLLCCKVVADRRLPTRAFRHHDNHFQAKLLYTTPVYWGWIIGQCSCTCTYSPVSCSLVGRVKPVMLNRSLTSWPLMLTSSWDWECRLGEMFTSNIHGFRRRSNMTSKPNNSWTLYGVLTLAFTLETTEGSELCVYVSACECMWVRVHCNTPLKIYLLPSNLIRTCIV